MPTIRVLPLLFLALVACQSQDNVIPLRSNDEASLTPRELLGKRIFEDTTLSEPRGQSCASCHAADRAFTGNNGSRIEAVALGSRDETFGGRNVPPVMYASYSPPFEFAGETNASGVVEYSPSGGQFWDGRAADLSEQAKGPFLNPREMNNASVKDLMEKIRKGPNAELFLVVFGGNSLADEAEFFDDLAGAIAAFEESARFHPFSSRFDAYLEGKGTLEPAEERGLSLFIDPQKGNCIACHSGVVGSSRPGDWLFTDFSYDNLGVPRNPAIPDNDDPDYFDLGLCRQPGIETRAPSDFDIESLCGAFKVPSLRNVALTAPYMHNGYFTNLRDVVKFYVTRGTNPEFWYPFDAGGDVALFNDIPKAYRANVNTSEAPYDRKPGEQPRLTDAEIDDVVAFLGALTDR